MRFSTVLAAICAVLLVSPVAGQQAVPVLRYTIPQNTMRQAIQPAEDYAFTDTNASIQIYQFRPYTGDIRKAFETTMLREMIAPMHQEERLVAPPTFQQVAIPGAELAITATFADGFPQFPKPHQRLLLIAANQLAIVDTSAGTLQSWQHAVPALTALAQSLRVEMASGPPPLTAQAGRSIAGVYMGMKAKYVASTINITGHGTYQNALHFYVFSSDGRVYRHYDQVTVPGGNADAFDFAGAQAADPPNFGHYTVDGAKLIIQIGGIDSGEQIVTAVPSNGDLLIDGVHYKKK